MGEKIKGGQSEVVVSYVKPFAQPDKWNKPLKLTGLEEDGKYKMLGEDIVLGEDELMNIGLVIPELEGDYAAKQWILRKYTP